MNRRVVRAALKLGFEVSSMISESLLNAMPSLPLHRVCMLNGQSFEHLLSLVRAGQAHFAEETAPPHGRGDGRAIAW
jgi:hypothetical protein